MHSCATSVAMASAPFLHHLQLHEDVIAFSTTRHGGCSEGRYGTFNICPYTGDNPQHIQANREILAKHLSIAPNHIVLPHQTHSVEVRVICSPEVQAAELYGVDAIITQLKGLCIGVSTADCIPILLYDKAHQAIAAIHAGWRGTVGRIVERTIATMQATIGTEPANLFACIGPGISCAAYEVGDELVDTFAKARFDIPSIATHTASRWHIDLPRANENELIRCGVPQRHITRSTICTWTQHKDFFSARREGIHSGRIFTGVTIP